MRLSDYLTVMGWSQHEFARRAGVSQAQICRWASGKQEPSIREALRLFQHTGGQVGLLDMLSPQKEGLPGLQETWDPDVDGVRLSCVPGHGGSTEQAEGADTTNGV